MTKRLHICLLTSGRVFESVYGEERFTVSLGNWLARRTYDVTVMGSGFASVKAKRLSKFAVKEEDKKIIIKKQEKFKTLHPPYLIWLLSRLVLLLLWIH